MTGTRNPQQDGSIQEMLRDSGLEAATELRGTLEQLQTFVPDEAPAPRGDLAALLGAGSPAAAGTAGVTSLAARRGRKRRLALIGGAVVGAMSLGAGAVAASSQDFREGVGHTFTVIFHPSAPTPAPAPARTGPADIPPVPVPAPAPAKASAPATVPAGAAPGTPSAAASAPAAEHPVPAVTPPATGRGGVLPTPGQRPVTPRFPGQNGNPGQNGRGVPSSPLPTVPAIPELPSTSSGS